MSCVNYMVIISSRGKSMRRKLYKRIIIFFTIVLLFNISGCSFQNKNNLQKTKTNTTQVNKTTAESENIKVENQAAKMMIEVTNLSNRLSKAQDSESINLILKEYQNSNINNMGVYFAKETGEFYLVPNVKLPEDYDPKKRSWYVSAIEKGSYISSTYQDISNGKKVITVSKTVYRDNKAIGVVGIDQYVGD